MSTVTVVRPGQRQRDCDAAGRYPFAFAVLVLRARRTSSTTQLRFRRRQEEQRALPGVGCRWSNVPSRAASSGPPSWNAPSSRARLSHPPDLANRRTHHAEAKAPRAERRGLSSYESGRTVAGSAFKDVVRGARHYFRFGLGSVGLGSERRARCRKYVFPGGRPVRRGSRMTGAAVSSGSGPPYVPVLRFADRSCMCMRESFEKLSSGIGRQRPASFPPRCAASWSPRVG
jgi:hypothetical protein